jgi:cell wall-associated NlpC family hydrolase
MKAWAAGGVRLPHYSEAQYLASTPISAADLQPGDLVFWQGAQERIHHVALYIGDGQIIHAPRTGDPVQIVAIQDFTPPDYFGRPKR